MSSFSVNNNSAASGILANLSFVQNEINTSYSQLSSGNRINSAANDPAGYAIAQQMTEQVNGLNQATQNAQQGVSLIQTATGGMNQVANILQTLNTLANEAANSTQSSNSQTNLQTEVTQLLAQITSTATNTQYNTTNLLDGTANITLQVGTAASQTLNFAISSVSTGALNITGISVASVTFAEAAITSIQSAITTLSTDQAKLGSYQDQLNYTISNLQNSSLNLQNAEATITNTNMAQAYTQFSQQQVVQQVGLAMLGQAQQQPAAILKLLG